MSKYENTSQASTMTAGPAGQCIQHSACLKGPATVSSGHKVVRSVLGRSAHQFWDAAAMLFVFCNSADPVHFRVSQSRTATGSGESFPYRLRFTIAESGWPRADVSIHFRQTT